MRGSLLLWKEVTDRQVDMKITRWTLLEDMAAAAFVASLVLLGVRFMSVWGGALGILLFGASAHFVAAQNSKAAREVLERLSYFGYSIMVINIVTGLKKAFPIPELFWSICASVALIFATIACLSLVNLFLPPHRMTAELPPWGAHLWKKLMIPLIASLFLPTILQLLGSVVGIYGEIVSPERTVPIVLLLSCVMIGVYSLRGVPRGSTDHSVLKALRRALALSPVWIIVGSAAELLRGEWVTWSVSVLTMIVVLSWTTQLSQHSTVLTVVNEA